MKFSRVWVLWLLLLSFSTAALAKDTALSGILLDTLSPGFDPYGTFSVESPRLLTPQKFYFQLFTSYAHGHLLDTNINGTSVKVVDKLLTHTLTLGYGISSRFALGVGLPYTSYAREANFNTLNNFTARGLGDVLVSGKMRVLREGKRGFALSLSSFITFPTADNKKFLGDPGITPGFSLITGKTIRQFSFMGEVGYTGVRERTIANLPLDDRVTFGAGVTHPLKFMGTNTALLGEVHGHIQPDNVQNITAPFEWGLGLKKSLPQGFSLALGGGAAITNAIGNPKVRGFLALGYTPAFSFSRSPPKIEKILHLR